MNRFLKMENVSISGFNPQYLHRPKKTSNDESKDGTDNESKDDTNNESNKAFKDMKKESIDKVNEIINKNTYVRVTTIDQKEDKNNYEGQLVGLDSRGNIILQYYDKKDDNTQKKPATNQPKQDSKMKNQMSGSKQPLVKHPKQDSQQLKNEPQPLFLVIKLSYISKIITIPKTENK